ncbi:MAG TPA: universal stress protein [Actinomycetota bacterium]
MATDRSETADRAVGWAAALADRYAAELLLVQVVVPTSPGATEYGAAEATRAGAAADELQKLAFELAGERARSQVLVHDDPAMAIVRASEEERADVLVVGNAAMAGRKEFLARKRPQPDLPQRTLHGDHRQHLLADGVTAQVVRPTRVIREGAHRGRDDEARGEGPVRQGVRGGSHRPSQAGRTSAPPWRSWVRRSPSSARSSRPVPTSFPRSSSRSSRRSRTTCRRSPKGKWFV